MSSVRDSARSISPPPKRRKLATSSHDKSQLVGDQQKSQSSQPLRVFSWNVDGIAKFLQPSISSYFKGTATNDQPLASLRSFLRRNGWPQVVHLQEVMINPSDEATLGSVRKAVNAERTDDNHEPTYSVHFCLPTDKYNARGFGRKVHGVASIIRDDFLRTEVKLIRTVDWDLEGRVLVIETSTKLALFNIYAVNGTTNEYRDSITGLPKGTRHDRKLEFQRLLAQEGRQLEQRGLRLVMSGDFNIAPAPIDGFPSLRTFPEQHAKNRADFHAKFLLPRDDDEQVALNAVDSFRYLHPTQKAYSWASRTKDWLTSCDRVDLILLSRALVYPRCALKEAGILMTQADRGQSDHMPIYVTLDVDAGSDEAV